MDSLFIEDLHIGQSASLAKSVSAEDITTFAEVTGDRNPVHLSEHYAAKTFFKSRIAHGMLSAGFISAVLGTRLPGPGAIYMSQTLKFLAPVRIGDTVVTTVTVATLDLAKKRAQFHCRCEVADKTVVEGEAMVFVPSRQVIAAE
jgi:3-hydroxybutyryl-CoA dehydratase